MKKYTLFLFLVFLSLNPLQDTFYSKEVGAGQESKQEIVSTKLLSAKKTSLLFVGDIMLGRYVETLTTLFGKEYSFKEVDSLLSENTYVIANLEGPLPENHEQTPSQGFGFSFDDSVSETLSKHHISAVSLANNHTSDQGEKGYVSTVQKLARLNIASFGHSRYFLSDFVTHDIGITLSTIGINLITPSFDENNTLSTIQDLCQKHPETSFVAFIHAGTEYTHLQSDYQVIFAHKLIDETCVRLIIGSHPHVVQGIERYRGKYIIYSLGNFIFDQYFSKETQEGLTVLITENDKKLQLKLIPIIEDRSVPRVALKAERAKILADIASSSSKGIQDMVRNGFLEE